MAPAPKPTPNPFQPTRDRLCTIDEAAPMLGKTAGALRWMIHNGTAPRSAKIGGRRLFRESDILAFIDAAFADGEG